MAGDEIREYARGGMTLRTVETGEVQDPPLVQWSMTGDNLIPQTSLLLSHHISNAYLSNFVKSHFIPYTWGQRKTFWDLFSSTMSHWPFLILYLYLGIRFGEIGTWD